MLVEHIITLLVTGIGVGFASGLLGVGGGFIMNPVQFGVYSDMGLPSDIAIRLAFGTNLFVILPTALSGAWSHHRKQAVWWRAAIILGVCGLIGAFGGASAAAHISGPVLKTAFGGVILASAVRMLTARPLSVEGEIKDRPWLWAVWGLPLGVITGLIGIGGGILLVPVMVVVFRFRMHQAVGTSMGIMVFTSLGGILGYMVNGLGVAGIPSPHIGYVHLWSWLALVVTTVPMAQVGAIATHRLPARQLMWIFIAVMVYMGLKMIGLFDWLGLPL